MFPVIDPKARPTTKPKIFLSLLWKQLNHLGNVGFDPAVFRIDPYGNVLYFHADSTSPLAWGFDHWFPFSIESHHFPQHFVESKEKVGLSSAAVVVSRRDPYDPSLVLRSLDYNRQTPG